MQQREQRILKKLAEARAAQAGAMSRFTQARARAAQVEARLQTLRARLSDPSLTSEDTPETPQPVAQVSAAQTPDIIPTTPITIAPITPVQSLANTIVPADAQMDVAPPDTPSQKKPGVPQFRPPFAPEQPGRNTDMPFEEDTPLFSDEDEDEEATKKVPAFRPTQPLSSAQRHIDEEETLIISHAELESHIDEKETLIISRSELESHIDEKETLIISHAELASKEQATDSLEALQSQANKLTAQSPAAQQENDRARESL